VKGEGEGEGGGISKGWTEGNGGFREFRSWAS
jgi:hypothetical protein